MAKSQLPTIDELRKYLRYEPDTGMLFWKTRTPSDFPAESKRAPDAACRSWNTKWAGRPALSYIDAYGYFGGRFFRRAMKAHRVAYAIYHGEWPKGDVDHINGDRRDNRIENLRDCNRSQNLSNSRKARGASSYRGVSRSGNRWAVWCSKNNKSVYGGKFDDEIDAALAFDSLATRLHGEYAGLNFPSQK